MIILDNGGYTLKYATKGQECTEVQNCLARFGREIVVAPETLSEVSEVRRPVQRGVLVDPQLQSKVWKKTIGSANSLLVNYPLYSPSASRAYLDELMFEKFQFLSGLRLPTGFAGSGIIVDIGFSATSIMPVYSGIPINYATKRIDVGGKLLTNYLKEQISFRQYDMREESWLVNLIKEKLCRVSFDFLAELSDYKHNHRSRVYVLPDGNEEGHFLREYEDTTQKQTLDLGNLEISLPELLFNPSDIGINQAGIPEVLAEVVNSLPDPLKSVLCSNIIVVGGSSNFSGLQERLGKDLRASLDTNINFNISKGDQYSNWRWLNSSQRELVTKEQYLEMGSEYLDSRYYFFDII